jgi:hypothetical protein
MIHERKLDKQLHINDPLTTCVVAVAPLSVRLSRMKASKALFVDPK